MCSTLSDYYLFLSIYPSIHPSVRPSFHPSNHPSNHPSTHPPTHPSTHPSIHLFIYLSINQSINQSIKQSIMRPAVTTRQSERAVEYLDKKARFGQCSKAVRLLHVATTASDAISHYGILAFTALIPRCYVLPLQRLFLKETLQQPAALLWKWRLVHNSKRLVNFYCH